MMLDERSSLNNVANGIAHDPHIWFAINPVSAGESWMMMVILVDEVTVFPRTSS